MSRIPRVPHSIFSPMKPCLIKIIMIKLLISNGLQWACLTCFFFVGSSFLGELLLICIYCKKAMNFDSHIFCVSDTDTQYVSEILARLAKGREWKIKVLSTTLSLRYTVLIQYIDFVFYTQYVSENLVRLEKGREWKIKDLSTTPSCH